MAVKALVGVMANTTAQAAAETFGDKLSVVRNEALITRWLKNFQRLRPKKLIILGGTLGNVEKKAIIDKLATTPPGLEEETLEKITLQCGG